MLIPKIKNKIFKNNSGFSLLETLFAASALIIAGVFIAQVFVVSRNANERAKNIDMAVSVAASAIDSFKSGAGIKDAAYYDKDWNPIGGSGEGARFIFSADVVQTDVNFYTINVTIIDANVKNESKRTLVDFNAAYYDQKGTANGN